MDIYKKAIKQKIRFKTDIGNLNIESLFDLSLTQLDKVVVDLEESLDKSSKKSYLKPATKENTLAKLKFDVAYDILTDKLKAQETAAKAQETKKHNEKLDELILKKQEQDLEKLSIEDLEKLRK